MTFSEMTTSDGSRLSLTRTLVQENIGNSGSKKTEIAQQILISQIRFLINTSSSLFL